MGQVKTESVDMLSRRQVGVGGGGAADLALAVEPL